MGWLTAFMSDASIALVEDGTLLRPRQFDMGNSRLEEWTASLPRHELMARMEAEDSAFGPVYSIPDALNDPHFVERGVYQEMVHQTLGKVITTRPTPRLSDTPGEVRYLGPELGEHNDEVYRGLLGLTEGECKALKADAVI